jgi:hypothetical protein
MINPYVILAAVAFWLASMVGAGWLARNYTQGEYAERENIRLIAWNEALDKAAERVGTLTSVNKTIYVKGEKIIEREQVLRDCKNPPEMIEAINAAAKGGAK